MLTRTRTTSVSEYRPNGLWKFIAVLALGVAAAACDSMDATPDPVPLEVQLAENVEADPVLGRDPVTGAPSSFNRNSLYELEDGAVVVSSSEGDAATRRRDSSATVWDIGFKGTTIIFNGGSSGPGTAAAQIMTEAFASVLEAPEGGYMADGENTNCPTEETPVGLVPGTPLAVCTGSDNGWYNYNGQANLILPIPGRTIVLRTAEGNYAKIRILSYYRDNPETPSADTPLRYYTFEYIVQTDGSRILETTTES